MRNDGRNARVSVSRIDIDHAVARVAQVRVVSRTSLVERDRRIGHLAARRVGDEIAQVEREVDLRAQRDVGIEDLGGRRPVSPRGCRCRCRTRARARSPRARSRSRRAAPRSRWSRRARSPRSAAPTPVRGRAPSRPSPSPHAKSAGAAQPAVADGRNASATRPPASATPPVIAANARREHGRELAHDDGTDRQAAHDERARDRRPAPHDHEEQHREEQRAHRARRTAGGTQVRPERVTRAVRGAARSRRRAPAGRRRRSARSRPAGPAAGRCCAS